MKKIELLALVDDDDTFVFITKRIIEKTDYVKEIKVFSNGLEALNYLKENLNSEYKLPVGIELPVSMPINAFIKNSMDFTRLRRAVKS